MDTTSEFDSYRLMFAAAWDWIKINSINGVVFGSVFWTNLELALKIIVLLVGLIANFFFIRKLRLEIKEINGRKS